MKRPWNALLKTLQLLLALVVAGLVLWWVPLRLALPGPRPNVGVDVVGP